MSTAHIPLPKIVVRNLTKRFDGAAINALKTEVTEALNARKTVLRDFEPGEATTALFRILGQDRGRAEAEADQVLARSGNDLVDGLGARWATAETSFKYHASCRHTHPAADALLHVMQTNGLKLDDLAQVVTHVHQGAIDVLGPVVRPVTVHQSKFSMGTVLALVAQHGHAGLTEFDRDFLSQPTQALRDKVSMVLDAEVDSAYPKRWIGKVTVTTTDGRVLHGRVDEPKGDPGNTLSRQEITDKALRLAAFSGGATPEAMRQSVDALWQVASWPTVGPLLP